MLRNNENGFTLVELTLVIAIVVILATLAYPSYTKHVTKTKRAKAEVALMQLASKMEQYYYANQYSYENATLPRVEFHEQTEGYKITIQLANINDYIIAAIPQGKQIQNDKKCGTLTLNQVGKKNITGTGNLSNCW